jgi:hypothetical protein
MTAIAHSLSVLVLSLAVLVVAGERSNAEEPVVPPPTLPADQPTAAVPRHRVIPEGFLPEEQQATIPLSQPDVHWVRNDGPNLPPMLSPCGGSLKSDKARVDGRQLVLVGASGWKGGRLVVYRDVKAAKAAVREIRSALRRCERHQFTDGETTVWASETLPIGDDALFVGGAQFRGDTRVPGQFRGVVMRKGRAVQTYLDCGQAIEQPTPAIVQPYQDKARAMAAKLARARWAR